MSSVHGGVLLKLISPVEWRVRVAKVDGERYKLTYTEVFIKPQKISKEEFMQAAEASVKLMKTGLPEASFKYRFETEDRMSVTMEVEASLPAIAGLVASEFLAFSKLGEMTLRELLVMAGIGGITVTSARSQAEKEVGRDAEEDKD